MGDLSDIYKTDNVDTVMAADINAVMDSTLRSAWSRETVIDGELSLVDVDYPIQSLAPTADSICYLPTGSIVNHVYVLYNNGTTYRIEVRTDEDYVVGVLQPMQMQMFVPFGNDTWKSIAFTPFSGWAPVYDTWTYASATTITVPSGATAKYSVGDKIMLTQTTTKYFYVVGVASTTLTITGGSDYTLANADILYPHISHASSPAGFPLWMNYTPTGIAASNVTLTGQFMLAGQQCFVNLKAVFSGGITFTTHPSLPITANAALISRGGATTAMCGIGAYYDASGPVSGFLYMGIIASATVVTVVSNIGVQISASSPITWAASDVIELHFNYMI